MRLSTAGARRVIRAPAPGRPEEPKMKRLAQFTIAVAAVAACGCANADTAPISSLVGTLVLASYNGSALPAYLEPRLGACSSMIAGGSLTTAADGRVVFSRSYTTPCTPGSPSTASESRTGTLSVAGTTITVVLDANSLNAAQVYTGTLTGGELTLHYTAENRTTPLEQTFVLVRQ
jgi:hypothetical protein